MRFSFAAATALLGTAQAHINGFAVPATIKPGDTINVIIKSSDHYPSYDVAIAFGWTVGKEFPNAINNPINSFYLGPKQSNQHHDFEKSLTIPKNVRKGNGLISLAVFSLESGVNYPAWHSFNVSVKFDGFTSRAYKSSK